MRLNDALRGQEYAACIHGRKRNHSVIPGTVLAIRQMQREKHRNKQKNYTKNLQRVLGPSLCSDSCHFQTLKSFFTHLPRDAMRKEGVQQDQEYRKNCLGTNWEKFYIKDAANQPYRITRERPFVCVHYCICIYVHSENLHLKLQST